jgi:hypothetical protein
MLSARELAQERLARRARQAEAAGGVAAGGATGGAGGGVSIEPPPPPPAVSAPPPPALSRSASGAAETPVAAPYPSDVPPALLVGTRIPFSEISFAPAPGGGRFLLGAGRVASVYAGTLRGEPVAVKVVPAAAVGAAGAARFWAEVDLSVALSHERLVRALGAAVATDASGAPVELALVMAREAGGDAGKWAASDAGRAAPLGARLRVLADVALGLRFLHARGVTHGNVKPSNVLLSRAVPPRAVLADFGHARALVPRVRAPGRSLGGADAPSAGAGGGAWAAAADRGGGGSGGGAASPVAAADAPYVDPAPRGAAPSSSAAARAADVFAFAVSAWELLCSARALGGGADAGALLARGERPPLDALPVDVRADVGPLLERAWAADAAARPTAVELAAAFSAAAAREERTIRPAGGGASLGGAGGNDAFSCGICIAPMRNPSTAGCGGHNFCRDCLCRHIWNATRTNPNETPACPVCRAPIQKRIEDIKINGLLRDLLAARFPPRAVEAERVNSQGRRAKLTDGNYFCGAPLTACGGSWSNCRICTVSTCSAGSCNCNACHELDVADELVPAVEWHDDHRRVSESTEPKLHPSHSGHYRNVQERLRFPGAHSIRKYCGTGDAENGPVCTHVPKIGGALFSHWSCCLVREPNEPCTRETNSVEAPVVIHPSHTGDFRRISTRQRFPGAHPINVYCRPPGSAADEDGGGRDCEHINRDSRVLQRDHMSCCGIEDPTKDCKPPTADEKPDVPSHPSHKGSWRWTTHRPPIVVHPDGSSGAIKKYCCEVPEPDNAGPVCTHGAHLQANHYSCCGVKKRSDPCPAEAVVEGPIAAAARSSQNRDGVLAHFKAGHYYCLRTGIASFDGAGVVTCRSTLGDGSDGRNCAACNALDEAAGLGAARWHTAVMQCSCMLRHNEAFPVEGAHTNGLCRCARASFAINFNFALNDNTFGPPPPLSDRWACCGKDWRSTTCVGVPTDASPQARAVAAAANLKLSPIVSAACDTACADQHPRGLCFVCGEGFTFHREHMCTSSGARGRFPIEVGCDESCSSRHDGAPCLKCGQSYMFHNRHTCIRHGPDNQPLGMMGRGSFPLGTERDDEQSAIGGVPPELAQALAEGGLPPGGCPQQ